MIRIYIDTNIFLDFYQSAKDRMAIFQELIDRADSICLPDLTIREFRRNRAARLNVLALAIDKCQIPNLFSTAIILEMSEFKNWTAARDASIQHANAIKKKLIEWSLDESKDPVYQQFVKLCDLGMRIHPPEDVFDKAHKRKLLGDPPTTPDKHTIGDEIIWETLLAACQDDLIVVSRDRTFLDNESLLRSEFNRPSGRCLVAVTGSLSDALKRVGKPSQSIEEAEQKSPLRIGSRTFPCAKCGTEMDGDVVKTESGIFPAWLSCPKCGRMEVPG